MSTPLPPDVPKNGNGTVHIDFGIVTVGIRRAALTGLLTILGTWLVAHTGAQLDTNSIQSLAEVLGSALLVVVPQVLHLKKVHDSDEATVETVEHLTDTH